MRINCITCKLHDRIKLKWWPASTSFKIYLDILSYLYIMFTIFYDNTISLKCTFFLFEKIYSTLSEHFQHSIVVIGNDCTGSCKFNYYTTTTVQGNTTELNSNGDLLQPHLKYTLTFFHTCISCSRYFITTLFHSSVHFSCSS
jgi:hypothetical protein